MTDTTPADDSTENQASEKAGNPSLGAAIAEEAGRLASEIAAAGKRLSPKIAEEFERVAAKLNPDGKTGGDEKPDADSGTEFLGFAIDALRTIDNDLDDENGVYASISAVPGTDNQLRLVMTDAADGTEEAYLVTVTPAG
ncbi:hypothetical protein ACFVAJ_17105 [Agromyces sp. NPDC057679]|uniref:hypothetical protein n=1 Tax=Agromyces sp. NPDC057679 TaxID=3346207 RepID=UPI0036728816